MKRAVLTTILIIAASVFAEGQEKVISVAQFNAVWQKACEKTKILPHVNTETDEDYYDEGKPPHHSYISITRYLPLDRVWSIDGRKDGSDDQKYEEIRIGRKSYSRDGKGPWKFKELGFSGLYQCEPEEPTSPGNGTGVGSGSSGGGSGMTFEYEYRYLGPEGLAPNSPQHYVRIKRMIITGGGFESQTTFKNSYWIGNSGSFLKTESTTRIANSPQWSRKLREYDYDAKDLKIEAPIK